MTVVHIVSVGFKPEVSQDQITNTCHNFIALGQKCIHPSSNKPYIKSARGGKDNSPEGMQDPAHLQFVDSFKPLIKTLQINDFTPAEF
ncbi:MAG: hypothetical protein Q9162_000967 [Coniocarpon cinnabarinum]